MLAVGLALALGAVGAHPLALGDVDALAEPEPQCGDLDQLEPVRVSPPASAAVRAALQEGAGRVRLDMVELPSFLDPKSAVAIAERDGRLEVRWALARVELWVGDLFRQANPSGSRNPSLEPLRCSAPLSPATFEKIHAVWLAALDARAPCDEGFRNDGTRYEFGVYEAAQRPRLGEAWSPAEETRLAALVDLGQALARFACADPARRTMAESEIAITADALLARFSPDAPQRP
jgi:hypothetical protein